MNENTTTKGHTTTFVAELHTPEGVKLVTRTTDSMGYTHAVVASGQDGSGAGCYSWHTSEVLARKAAQSLTNNANIGTAKTGDIYTVVPVVGHQGSKATVLKRLAAEQTPEQTPNTTTEETTVKTETAPAKKTTAKKATADKSPVGALITKAVTPAKKTAAKKATPAKPADGVLRGSQRKVTGAAEGKRIKKDGSYSVAEVAELVGTTTAAVQRWVKLEYVKATKEPTGKGARVAYRINGGDLTEFLKTRKG